MHRRDPISWDAAVSKHNEMDREKALAAYQTTDDRVTAGTQYGKRYECTN